jgi:hypothetical protein
MIGRNFIILIFSPGVKIPSSTSDYISTYTWFCFVMRNTPGHQCVRVTSDFTGYHRTWVLGTQYL